MNATTSAPRISLTRRGTVRIVATQLAEGVSEPGPRIYGPRCAAEALMKLVGSEDREHFVVLLLDASHHIAASNTVSIGVLDSAHVHPREVFKAAILANAKAIICGHNHPSGSLEPSAEDRATSAKLREAGDILGIKVLDSIIVSRTGYYSFQDKEAGW